MACNYQRNSSGEIVAVITDSGQQSILYKQLANISDNKPEVAARLFAVTETKEFKTWIEEGKGVYKNNVEEPALFGEFYTRKDGATWWAKAINTKDATTKFPFGLNRVPGLTTTQVNDIANFTYAYLLRKAVSVETTESIDLNQIKNIIEGLKNTYTKIGDLEVLNTLSILEEDVMDKKLGTFSTRSKFIELIRERLKADGLVEDDVKEEDKTNPLNIKERYFKSPKDSASVSLKLMLKSIMDTENRDSTLGQPTPAAFSPTFNLLLRELAGAVPYQNSEGVVDLYDIYKDKLEVLSVDYPYLNQLIAKLENSEEHVRTRFVNGLALEKLTYTQTLYEGGIRQKTYKVGMPSAQQGFEIIRSEWTEAFKDKMFDYNKNANIILNETYAKSIIPKYNKLRKNSRPNSEASIESVQKDFKNLLNSIGIEVSDKTIKKFYRSKESIFRKLESSKEGLGFIFTDKKSGIPSLIKRFSERAKSRKNTIKLDDSDLPIKNEKAVRKLAIEEESFRPEYVDNSSLGPQGDMYWGFGNYSWMAQVFDTIKQEDSELLEQLAKLPFNINSKWINQLQNGRKVDRSVFMQMKENNSYEGTKYFQLQDPDQLADRIARVMKGEHILMTPGNSRTLYTLSGFEYESSGVNVTYDPKTNQYNFEYVFDKDGKNNVIETFRGYIEDEFAAMEVAYSDVFEDGLSKQKQIVNYHYDNKNNERDSDGKPAGNAFKHTLFPELTFGEAYSQGFYTQNGKPIYNSKLIASERITELIKMQYEKYVTSQIEKAVEYKLIDNNLANRELPTNFIKSERFNNLGSLVIGRIFSDYVLSNIVANVESTKLFVGDVKFYKTIDDFIKRANLYTTSVVPMRFIKGEVHPTYLHATVDDIFSPSKYLQGVEGYENVDLADATTWITPELQKQRMKGFGEFTPEVEAAYDRMIKGEMQISDVLKLTPRKSAARGTEIKNGMNVPYREKTAEVVLWPGLVNDSGLKVLYDKMIEEESIHKDATGAVVGIAVSVESAIKVGAGLRIKIDNDQGEILDDFTLNPIVRSHLLYGKQQDIPTKGIKDGTFGSQLKINILADIDDTSVIGNRSGVEWKQELEELESNLSDLGREEFLNKYGIDPDTYETLLDENGNDLLYKGLINTLSKQSFPDKALIEGLENGLHFDAIFQSRRKIINTLANELTKSTVTYSAKAASLVQISSFGLFQSATSVKSLDSSVRSKIRYLKDGKLKPPRIENGKLKLGDIFIPYSYIESIPGYESMSSAELKQRIGKDVLTVIGYRIPNQSLASTDALEIAGILPKEAGDTVVVYEEMTAKTGSDFDIDKLFMLMPNVEYNKETQKLELIDPNGTTKRSLENKRILLYKELFQTVEQYPRIIKSIDTQKLKSNAYELIDLAQEQDDFDGLKLFTGEFQQDLKTRFSAGAAGVGATANNTIDNVMAQGAKLHVPFLGMQSKTATIGEELRTILYSTDKINGDLISEIMSGYMNAFVDIEKDPYITKINFTKPVMNVAYLMLRAGIDPKFINAFIKQPIIVEYAKQAALGRSKLLNPNFFISEQAVIKSLGAEARSPVDIPGGIELNDLLLGISPDEESSEELEKNVLDYFAFLHPIAEDLFEQNLASKVHTEGVGQDLLDATIKIERKEALENSATTTIGNFSAKFAQGTMLGKYFKNGPELFEGVFYNKFLSGKFDYINEEIKNLLGDYYKHNYRSRRSMEDAMYSYMYSSHDTLGSLEELLFDTATKKSLVPKLIEMKASMPKSILLNQVLKYKYNRNAEGIYNSPSQLYVANTKNMPPDTVELAKQEWEDMLNSEDKNISKFANDLAAYAYHSSGFKRGIQTFHQLIPGLWNAETNFNDTVRTIELEHEHMIGLGIEQVVKHEYTNKAFAPRVKKAKKISASIDFDQGFVTKMENNYLTRFSDNKLSLYRYVGPRADSNGKLSENIYERINTLGFKGEDGFRVVEYKFGESDVNSIFADNKITLSREMQEIVKGRRLVPMRGEAMKTDKPSELDKCK
tara:strand:+ start:15095 stop:21109 length:6015 start_codon:yes stop_codon:yes gene_type:complete